MWKINRQMNPSAQPRLEEWRRLLLRMQSEGKKEAGYRAWAGEDPCPRYVGTFRACMWATSSLRATEREHVSFTEIRGFTVTVL